MRQDIKAIMTNSQKENTYIIYEKLWIMEARLNGLAEIVDWNLPHEEKEGIRCSLTNIENVLNKIKTHHEQEKKKELEAKKKFEKQLVKDYQDWADDPDEWKDARGE